MKAFNRDILKAFGPGILFASTAIGVSHLVQSTRAGADFGWGLWWAVLLANFFKYPFFEFGSRYAIATSSSLLDGYFKKGKGWLLLYLLLTFLTMFTVCGAVTFTTAGMFVNLTGFPMGIGAATIVLFTLSAAILLTGGYRWLDKLIKVVAVLLLISTVAVFVLAMMGTPAPERFSASHTYLEGRGGILFIIALMGWMPSAVDLSAWNSLWTLERKKETGYTPTLFQSLLDFRIGYVISTLLAFVFLGLGTLLLYNQHDTYPEDAIGFTQKLVSLYTSRLGGWSYYLITLSAFSIMFSTTISVLDGYGRAVSRSFKILGGSGAFTRYPVWILITAVGGFSLIQYFSGSFKSFIDIATILSLLVAPVVSWLNYSVMTDKGISSTMQPGKLLKTWSVAGIIFLTVFVLVYVVLNF